MSDTQADRSNTQANQSADFHYDLPEYSCLWLAQYRENNAT